jgi:hypothetical protein
VYMHAFITVDALGDTVQSVYIDTTHDSL